jgi:hypothetical protein
MKNGKDPIDFEDLGFEDQDSYLEEEDFDSYTPIDLSPEDDPIELERRKNKYASLRKSDKIFNNSYNMGSASSDDDARSSQNIKVDISSPHYHMYDKDHYSDHIDDTITQYDIDKYVSDCDEIRIILGDTSEKKKFAKSEINDLFRIISDGVKSGKHSSFFVSPIHILDTISSLTNMEYKKLFDILNYDYKETLLLELNKKYGFLDKPSRNTKIF